MKNYCVHSKAKATSTIKPATMKNATTKSVIAKSVTNSEPTTSTSINSSKTFSIHGTTSDTSTTKPITSNSTLKEASMVVTSALNNANFSDDEILGRPVIITSVPIKSESNSTGPNSAIGGSGTSTTPRSTPTQFKTLTNEISTSNIPPTTTSRTSTKITKITTTSKTTSTITSTVTTSTALSTAVPDTKRSREIISTRIQTTAISTTSMIPPVKTSTTKQIIQKNGTEYNAIETMKTISVATPNMFELDPMDDDELIDQMITEFNDTSPLYQFDESILNNTVTESVETGWAETVADSILNGLGYLKNALFGSDDDEESMIQSVESMNGYHRNLEQYENVINETKQGSLKLMEDENLKENWLSSWFRDESHSEILPSNFSLKPPNVEWDKKVLNLKNQTQASINSTAVTPSTEFWTTETFKTLATIPPAYYSQDDSYDDTGILIREGSGNISVSDDDDLEKYESLLRI